MSAGNHTDSPQILKKNIWNTIKIKDQKIKAMTKKVLFTINGFEVRENSTYIVKDKKDFDGPSGFAKEGITKVPGPGVGDTFQCRYPREPGTDIGVWDTGFYPHSPCYRNQDAEIVDKEIANLMTNLVEPYRRFTGKPTALSQEDEAFWNAQKFHVHSKKVLNTSSPVQLLELYFALRTYQVAPKGKERDFKYKEAAYIIVDQSKDVNTKNEQTTELFKTIGMFTTMMSTQKRILILILNYMGMAVSEEVEDGTLIGMFNEYLMQVPERASQFMQLAKEANTEDGQAKFDIYKKLKILAGRGGKVTKTPSGVFFYEDQEIGPDLKSAAESISKDSQMGEIRKEILLGDDK